MNESIIIRGIDRNIGRPVKTWIETGRQFRGLRLRDPAGQADLGILHWTAGENPASSTFAWMSHAGTSVHFLIDNDGVIHQFADPGLYVCSHAGRANRRSVGIEVTGYGWRKPGHEQPNPERAEYPVRIHGWKTRVADYLPAQYESLGQLCSTLSTFLGIPRKVCQKMERLTEDEFDAFHGWAGHFQVERLRKTRPKIDPGTRPLDFLSQYFSSPNIRSTS